MALYPAVDAAQKRELGTWWSPLILVFTQREMRTFLGNVRTVSGTPDRMFGFGFNDPSQVYQTRGDSKRLFRDHSKHLLSARAALIRKKLSA